MKLLIEEVLRLQPAWTHVNSPEMHRRGQLIRHEMSAWLRTNREALARRMGSFGLDLEFEGRDGTGPKSEIPWVRYYSAMRSPNAHQGWYCVYLFSGNGNRAYLCLAHGSTRYQNGEFRPRPPAELARLIAWARSLTVPLVSRAGASDRISLESKGELGRAYELGTVLAIEYLATTVPEDEELLADASLFAELLAAIYNAEELEAVARCGGFRDTRCSRTV